MSTVNRVILVGNLTRDAVAAPGLDRTVINVATTYSWRNANGWRQEETEVHEVTAAGKLGEICAVHCLAGKRVYIEGRLRRGEIVAETVRVLQPRPDTDAEEEVAP